MSDAVKWGLLGITFAAVCVLIGSFFVGSGLLGAINSAIDGFGSTVSAVVGYLDIGKRLLNNFFYPWALNFGLAVALLVPIVKYSITLLLAVWNYIYK